MAEYVGLKRGNLERVFNTGDDPDGMYHTLRLTDSELTALYLVLQRSLQANPSKPQTNRFGVPVWNGDVAEIVATIKPIYDKLGKD